MVVLLRKMMMMEERIRCGRKGALRPVVGEQGAARLKLPRSASGDG